MRLMISFATLLLAASVTLADSARVAPGAGARFSIEGSTNVGPWKCRGEHVGIAGEVSATAEEVEAAVREIETRVIRGPLTAAGQMTTLPRVELELTIPVRTLVCGNPRMERDMYHALRAMQHKHITFAFDRVVTADLIATRTYAVAVEGILKLAGESRRKRVTLKIEHTATGAYRLSGSLPLHMTEFNVKPPVALLGLIRANDALRVEFNIPVALR